MTSPREPLSSAAAELTAMLDAVKNRAKDAMADPRRADLTKQAGDVAATAAAAAATAFSGIATAAQTVGSVLDGWVQTQRQETASTSPAGATELPALDDAPADTPPGSAAGATDPTSGPSGTAAPAKDQGVAWD